VGNVQSADDWDELLLAEIERRQAQGQLVAFRADAASPKPAAGRSDTPAITYWLLLAESHLTRWLLGRCSSGSGRSRCRPG
jgi:hypothetical protein